MSVLHDNTDLKVLPKTVRVHVTFPADLNVVLPALTVFVQDALAPRDRSVRRAVLDFQVPMVRQDRRVNRV